MQLGVWIALSLSTALPALGFDEMNQVINRWIQSLPQVPDTAAVGTGASNESGADQQELSGDDAIKWSGDGDLDGSLDEELDDAPLDAVSADGQTLEAIEESRPDELDELAEVDGYRAGANEDLSTDGDGLLDAEGEEIDWTQPID